jgi:glycosyltransferase involved in cell wall biosynthesis
VRALALATRSSGVHFEYYIAGSGPDEAALEAVVREVRLEHKVKILGWMEPEALRALYLRCDVLIHPSPAHDPFPNAVLEGWQPDWSCWALTSAVQHWIG